MEFLDRPFCDFVPHFDNPTHGQQDDMTLKPQGIGAAIPWKPTQKVRRTLKLPFQFGTREEWRAFRDFVAARIGRLNGFFLPIWLTDYPSTVQDNGSDTITMKAIGLAGVFQPDEQFAFCALIRRDADIEPHKIDAVDVDGANEVLTLQDPIANDFPVDSSVLCGLMFCRIDDTAIKYEFISDGVIQCTVTFAELPREYFSDGGYTFPIYLFEIVRGGQTWRFTNYGKSIVLDGELWTNASIDISSTKADTDFIADQMSITFATDELQHPALFQILSRRAFEKTTVTIYKIDASDTELNRGEVFFTGKVGSSQTGDDGTVELTCMSNLQIGEASVPRTQNMRFCNLTTGDANCQVVLADFTTTANISAIQNDDPPYIEADEFGSKATDESDPNWFAMGKVTIGNETRMCVGQNGNRLYLDFGFFKAQVGDSAACIAGDNKRIETCDAKFNNLERYLGFTYTPNRNPNISPFLNPSPDGGKKG